MTAVNFWGVGGGIELVRKLVPIAANSGKEPEVTVAAMHSNGHFGCGQATNHHPSGMIVLPSIALFRKAPVRLSSAKSAPLRL